MILRYFVIGGMLAFVAGCDTYNQESARDQRLQREAAERNAADAVAGAAMNDVERLSSGDNPGAPDDTVAAAGVDAPTRAQGSGCQSPGALVGTWQSSDGNLRYEFTADGRMTFTGKALGTSTSRYCVIAPGRARIEGEGGTVTMEYTISPDGKSFSGPNAFGQTVVNTRVGG